MKMKPAILVVGANDTLFSYDLHIIDIMNNIRARMDELEWMKLCNQLLSLYNEPGVLPYHKLVYENNKLSILMLGKVDEPINDMNFQKFIYTKRDEFISEPIYKKIIELGFKRSVEYCPVRYQNINSITLLDSFTNFVVVDTKYPWSEAIIVSNMLTGDSDKQIISMDKLAEWMMSHVKRSYDNNDHLALMLTLISCNENVDKIVAEKCINSVPEDLQELIACESRIITLNPRIDIETLKEASRTGVYERSNIGIARLFDLNIFTK